MTTTDDGSLNPGNSAERAVSARHELLFDAWFDGTIADDEFAELEAGLLESRDVRRCFWERAGVHGMLREAARIRFATFPAVEDRSAMVAEVPARPAASPGFFSRSTLVSATRWLVPAGAWLVAVLVASTGVAYAHRWATISPALLTVHREGFENPPPPDQDLQPKRCDVWGGDETEVVGGEEGIVPHGGGRMLRFVSNHPRNAQGFGARAEIWRFVDLDALRAANGWRLGRIELSAFFNAAEPGDVVKPYGGVSLIATDTPPRDFYLEWSWFAAEAANRPAFMATAQVRQGLDGDRSSWQRLAAGITPPEGARYLVLHCFAERRRHDGKRLPFEAMGQYMDDVRLDILPKAVD